MMEKDDLKTIVNDAKLTTNYEFKSRKLLINALVTKAYASEHNMKDFKVMDVTGDKLLNLLVKNLLVNQDNLNIITNLCKDNNIAIEPYEMAMKMKDWALCDSTLWFYFEKLNLKKYIQIGKDEKYNYSTAASFFKALIGVIWTENDKNYDLLTNLIKSWLHFDLPNWFNEVIFANHMHAFMLDLKDQWRNNHELLMIANNNLLITNKQKLAGEFLVSIFNTVFDNPNQFVDKSKQVKHEIWFDLKNHNEADFFSYLNHVTSQYNINTLFICYQKENTWTSWFLANGFEFAFIGNAKTMNEAKQHAIFNFIDYYTKDPLPVVDNNLQTNAYDLLNSICLAYSCMLISVNNDIFKNIKFDAKLVDQLVKQNDLYTLSIFKKEVDGWKDTVIIEGCEYAFSANGSTKDDSKEKAFNKLVNYYMHKN